MIGKQLGKWTIEAVLGRGGMGTVYLARASIEGESGPETAIAAVKVLSPQLAHAAGFVERFAREINALSKLRHPHIVQLLESGSQNDCHYFVMEYVEGQNFERLLVQRGRMPWEEVLGYTLQTASALKHAHDHGVIHRDIKPQNLLLNQAGLVKLTDFGVAKVFSDERLTASQAVVGTADYMSPEQAAGKPVTRRSDIYSLGAVLYTLLTGRTPFVADTVSDMLHKHLYGQFDPPKSFVPDLPEEMNALIVQMLEKRPEARPPDALVVSRILERLQHKASQKSRATHDEVRTGSTLAFANHAGAGAAPASRPATLVGRFFHTEWEALNRAGPLGRLLNRAWVLLLLLAAIIGLAVWGFWPKSVAQRLEESRVLIGNLEYDEAEKILKAQAQRKPSPQEAAELADLQERIVQARFRQQARKLGGRWAGAFSQPTCEAERLYREGLLASYRGQVSEARAKWQLVVDAFAGITTVEPWVLLAQDALADTEKPVDDTASVDQAIRTALGEDRLRAIRRLDALASLYEHREDATARKLLSRIQHARADLGPDP